MKIIAELGLNHQGNPETAEEMIVAAADAGVDGVKLQTYRVGDFLPEGHPDWDMFESCEIWPHLDRLVEFAHDGGLLIGTTPTSVRGVTEAVEDGVDFLKNGSDFLLRTDLIQAMLDTGLPTWVSIGMATPDEVNTVPEDAKLMICTSAYPTPDDEANLLRLFRVTGTGRYAGFSDHTHGTIAAVCAAFVGAEMWEGHFTLDHTMDGPDHHFSRDPDEMAALVQEVRRTEVMRGVNELSPTPSEQLNRDKWRVTEGKLRG